MANKALWPRSRGNDANNAVSPYLGLVLGEKWRYYPPNRYRLYGTPVIDEDKNCYLFCYNGNIELMRLISLDKNGNLRFDVEIPADYSDPAMTTSPVIGPDGNIYIVYDTVHCFDKYGNHIWHNDLFYDGYWWFAASEPVVDDQFVYVAAGDPLTIFCLRIGDGSYEWVLSDNNIEYAPFYNQIAADDTALYIASDYTATFYDQYYKPYLVKISKNGQIIWRKKLIDYNGLYEPVLYKNYIFVVADRESTADLLAVDKETGQVIWIREDLDINNSNHMVSVKNDVLYVGKPRHTILIGNNDYSTPATLYALDIHTGNIIWQYNDQDADTVNGIVVDKEENVLFYSSHYLYVVNNGNLIYKSPEISPGTYGFNLTNPVLIDGALYLKADGELRVYETPGVVTVKPPEIIKPKGRIHSILQHVLMRAQLPGEALPIHFRVQSFVDEQCTMLINEIDSQTAPYLFEYSLNNGITWQPFPAEGLKGTGEILVRARMTIGQGASWLRASAGYEENA